MAQRMKIAHIITRLELGGAQENTLYCCAHHDRRKYETLLIAGEGGLLDEEARRIPGCKTYLLPELKHPIRPFWDLAAFSKIALLLRDEKVDLVHTHSSKAGILGRFAAKRAGVKHIVHTVHGWGFYPGQVLVVRKLYQGLERWAASFTDVLITVSEENKRSGLDAGIGREGQYRVFHSGIDPSLYRSSVSAALKSRKSFQNQGRPTVLVLSNFKAQKSPLDVVAIAVELKRSIPDVLFLWGGDGPLRSKVEDSVREKGYSQNFSFLGWRRDVAQLLAASDVLLLASRHEGLPRVVLQAMAAGKPVVATEVNGTPEAVKSGATGFLHEPGDTRGMSRSLSLLLTKPALARRMGKAGRRELKGTFLIRRMLREIEGVYRSLESHDTIE